MSDPIALALIKADRENTVAVEALQRIADMGVTRAEGGESYCLLCKFNQQGHGQCQNRKCPGRIAREALERMRR